MPELFLLSRRQMRRIRRFFPKPRGLPRVNDRRVISGIIDVIHNGLQWKDAPPSYGPHKTLYNRFVRWSRRGVFERIFAALAGQAGAPDRLLPLRGPGRVLSGRQPQRPHRRRAGQTWMAGLYQFRSSGQRPRGCPRSDVSRTRLVLNHCRFRL